MNELRVDLDYRANSEFIRHIDRILFDLMEGFLTPEPSHRYGSIETGGFQALKTHDAFRDFNFEVLVSKKCSRFLLSLKP